MTILAIDQSLTDSGYCISGSPIKYGSIKTGKLRGTERLAFIRNEVFSLITSSRAELVAIEDYSYGSTGHTFSLGELGGVIKLLCYEMGIQRISIPIGSWKKHCLGKGNVKKDLVLKFVLQKYGFDTDNDNIADAYCLLKFAGDMIAFENGKEFPESSVETFKKLRGDKDATI